MTGYDDRFIKALSADDQAFLKDLEKGQGLLDQYGATFSGPMRFWSVLVTIFIAIFAGVMFWSAWTAFHAAELREVVLFSALALWFAVGVAMAKLWLWAHMNHLALLKEMKRLELRLAKLAAD